MVSIADDDSRLATVDIAGVVRKVDISLLDDAPARPSPGDWVLIHVGFAIARIDEREAHATLRLLQELGAEFRTELEALQSSAGAGPEPG